MITSARAVRALLRGGLYGRYNDRLLWSWRVSAQGCLLRAARLPARIDGAGEGALGEAAPRGRARFAMLRGYSSSIHAIRGRIVPESTKTSLCGGYADDRRHKITLDGLKQGLITQVFQTTSQKVIRTAIVILAASALALASATIQVVGPEIGTYGNVCGPSGDDLCYQELVKGGFPFAFIFDNPSVSVRDQIGFFEDDFFVFPFVIDTLILIAVLWAILYLGRKALGYFESSRSK